MKLLSLFALALIMTPTAFSKPKEDLEKKLAPMLGEWEVDMSNVETHVSTTQFNLPCRIGGFGNADFRVRFVIEPKDTEFQKAGTPSVYIEENWGTKEAPKFERAFDRAAFSQINLPAQTSRIDGGRITHKAWVTDPYNALIHEVSGSYGWAQQTLHISDRTGELVYEYRYTDFLSERCVFHRPKK